MVTRVGNATFQVVSLPWTFLFCTLPAHMPPMLLLSDGLLLVNTLGTVSDDTTLLLEVFCKETVLVGVEEVEAP